MGREVLVFSAIGVASTAAYGGLYLVLLAELAALRAGNAASTVARFVLRRSWISARARGVAS